MRCVHAPGVRACMRLRPRPRESRRGALRAVCVEYEWLRAVCVAYGWLRAVCVEYGVAACGVRGVRVAGRAWAKMARA